MLVSSDWCRFTSVFMWQTTCWAETASRWVWVCSPLISWEAKRVCPVSNRVSLSFSLGIAATRAGRSLGKPSPRSAAALHPAAPGSRCPPAVAVTTRQAAASCRAKLRGGAARERQHAARGLRKPAPPWAPLPGDPRDDAGTPHSSELLGRLSESRLSSPLTLRTLPKLSESTLSSANSQCPQRFADPLALIEPGLPQDSFPRSPSGGPCALGPAGGENGLLASCYSQSVTSSSRLPKSWLLWESSHWTIASSFPPPLNYLVRFFHYSSKTSCYFSLCHLKFYQPANCPRPPPHLPSARRLF